MKHKDAEESISWVRGTVIVHQLVAVRSSFEEMAQDGNSSDGFFSWTAWPVPLRHHRHAQRCEDLSNCFRK